MDEEKKEAKEAKEAKEEELNDLNQCQKEKEEYLAGWQRARADLLNYKKEEKERIEQLLKYEDEIMIIKLLPILDSFDLIEKKINEETKKDPHIQGVLKIKAQLNNFLKRQDVEPIESVGKNFDPNFHDAIEEVLVENSEPGLVVEEIEKGYLINGRVLRPSKVRVSKLKNCPPDSEQNQGPNNK